MSDEKVEERSDQPDQPVKPEKVTALDVTLPSGLSGTIRRMKIKEMNRMSARSTVRKNQILEVLFKAVWLDTIGVGKVYRGPVIKFKETESGDVIVDWGKVLQGDRNVLLMEIRKLVRGTSFNFDHVCRGCKSVISWNVDLDKLDVYNLSEEAVKNLTSPDGKNEFKRTLPFSGDTVAFKLLQGIDQNAMAKRSTDDPDEQFTTSLIQRLVYVPGATSYKDRVEYIEDMDPEDAEYLQQEWTNTDCDVQTSIKLECPHCFKLQVVSMPLDDDFLFKRSSFRKKRSRK